MLFTRLVLPEGSAITRSPRRTSPEAICPAKPRKLKSGRFTHCTGNRNSPGCRPTATGTVSRYSINVPPSYQGQAWLGLATLSPSSALTGMKVAAGAPMRRRYSVNSSRMRAKTSSRHPTRSILFTATARCGMPSRLAMQACRRDCGSTPLRASTRITATSAVEAPVAMLRVYCSWPGVSAMMNFRRGVEKCRYATSMVMPCSRSARKPSVSSEKSSGPPVRFTLLARMAANWSSNMALASYSSRPMRVLLPSSTLPAVVSRTRSCSAQRARYSSMVSGGAAVSVAGAIRSSPRVSSTPSTLPGRSRWRGSPVPSGGPPAVPQ